MNRMLYAVAAALTVPVFAQPPTPTETPLKGPEVPREVAVTLVERNARGNFVRLQGRPEEAAAAKLAGDTAARERVREIGLERASSVGVFLIERLERVREIGQATEAGERDRAAEMLRELWAEFEPGSPESPVLEALARTMTMETRGEMRRLVDEYWSAWIDWELRNARDKTEAARTRVRERLAFGLFQDEVRQAYERVIKPYVDRVEALYAALDPTPEQRESIRTLIVAHVRESKARPTNDQRREILTAIYRVLDEERRAKLFDLVAREISN